MRRTWIVCAGLCLFAQSARAQTRVYVAGAVFADVTRFSRTILPQTVLVPRVFPPDDAEVGGGVRMGAFFSPAWSLELGLDLAGTHAHTETVTYPLPLTVGVIIRPLSYESESTIDFSATSMLIGYHPVVRGRIHPGFRGGVSVMHRRETYTVASTSYLYNSDGIIAPGLVTVLPAPLTTNDYTTIANALTATIGTEATITLSDHAAVVPELRLHAGGLGGVLLRPGVSVRWVF